MLTDSTYQASPRTVERLARILHQTWLMSLGSLEILKDAPPSAVEWEKLPEESRERRRAHAAKLIERLDVLIVLLA